MSPHHDGYIPGRVRMNFDCSGCMDALQADIDSWPQRRIDTAQAVAIEREAIAGWLDDYADYLEREWKPGSPVNRHAPNFRVHAQAIRNGEHHK